MDLQLEYPGNEVQFPSSDIDSDQTNSLPLAPSPNTFSQDEPDIRADWGPADFDLNGNAEPIPDDLERDLGNEEESVPATSTEYHPLINGM